jgi:hypothetical protein
MQNHSVLLWALLQASALPLPLAYFCLAPLSTFQDTGGNGCGTTSNLPRLTRIPRIEDQSPLVVRGKTAHSVDGLSAIHAAVRNSLSSVKNGTEQCARGTPLTRKAFSTMLAQFGHNECSIISVVAAVSPLCLLWGHFPPELRQ